MGVGSSIPQKESLTYLTTVQGKKINLEELLNSIFKWMLEKSDIIDYYAMASPKECRKYVKSTEEGLTKLFKTLEIRPSVDSKTGKIFFQKLSLLSELSSKGSSASNDEYKEQQIPAQEQMCTQIAFFYIRILQIFSALALSVLDTKIPEDYDSLTLTPQASVAPKGQQPLYGKTIQARPLQPQSIKGGGVFQEGGELGRTSGYYITNPSYSLLNRYLTVDGTSIELTDGSVRKQIFIQPSFLEALSRGTLPKGLPLSATLRAEDGTRYNLNALLQMSVEQKDKNLWGTTIPSYKANIVGMIVGSTKFSDNQLASLKPEASFKLQGNVFKYANQNIAQWISNIFYKALGYEVEDEGDDGEKISGYEYKRKERKSLEKNLPDDFPEKRFGIKKLASILKDSKPKAYCVSRAIQLLSPEQYYKDIPNPARTRICNSSFALADSSPILDKSVGEVKGLFYLEKLFYDKIVGSIPKISDSLLPQHQTFMNELKALYEPKTTEIQKKELDFLSIKEEEPILCQSKGRGVYQTRDKEVINTLRGYVGQLLNRQREHTGNVVRLLSELFVISTTEPLQLQPSVWKKGMPEIERIASKARELLMKYYNDCESTYQQGTLYISQHAAKFDK